MRYRCLLQVLPVEKKVSNWTSRPRCTAGRLASQAASSPMQHRLSQHQAYHAYHVGLHLPFAHSVTSPGVLHCVRTMGSVALCHSRRYLYPRGPVG